MASTFYQQESLGERDVDINVNSRSERMLIIQKLLLSEALDPLQVDSLTPSGDKCPAVDGREHSRGLQYPSDYQLAVEYCNHQPL